jgi:hypothetical protein
MAKMKLPRHRIEKAIIHVNRKNWWHVPPVDPNAYSKRGKFFASSFAEAEFWGRPQDEPHKVSILEPLIGEERTIAKALSIQPQRTGMTRKQLASHDALLRNAALKKGFDSILLMTRKSFAEFKESGKLPRSLELNILKVAECGRDKTTAPSNAPRENRRNKRASHMRRASRGTRRGSLARIGETI